ncbi:MAG: hypothetical protein ABIK62_01555, partial [candidate division WOR-3 bacterium]
MNYRRQAEALHKSKIACRIILPQQALQGEHQSTNLVLTARLVTRLQLVGTGRMNASLLIRLMMRANAQPSGSLVLANPQTLSNVTSP